MSNNNWGGRRAGAGRKSLREETELISVIDEAISRASKIKIIKAIAKKAEQGDVRAASLLMSYTFGRPVQVEKSGEELQPIDNVNEFGMGAEEVRRAFEEDVIRAYGDRDEEEEFPDDPPTEPGA